MITKTNITHKIKFLIFFIITIALIFVLNTQWGSIPPIGKFFSPQEGFWQNAEPVDENFNADLHFPQLKGKAEVYFDKRLVPHVFAENEEDAYFIQGYLIAKFRLWQMDFTARVAAGRLSEILGGKALNRDRSMRRLGMDYGAERMVREINKSPDFKKVCEAYVAGVNAYIDHLKDNQLPLEFKLLNYKPEHWTLMKIALIGKLWSFRESGYSNDLEFTNARTIFTRKEFEMLFPVFADSSRPVVPDTPENPYPEKPAVDLAIPANADSVYFNFKADNINPVFENKPDKNNGSNSWVVGPGKTQSGSPILCNDPHSGSWLPSLWYEMQIKAPSHNVYGVASPGAPGIIIGFNDSIAFGFTNSENDMMDYYNIRFRDSTMSEYRLNGKWVKAAKRIEPINIKGEKTLYDKVVYTVFGPVMYDRNFPANDQQNEYLAVRWKALDPSNDFLAWYKLNRAKNYSDYLEAIKNLTCPGMNCMFASKSGDIAIWHQGVFPAKWRRQGDFIMPGTDSTYMWRSWIPQNENPHMKNPVRGYVSSANQFPTDSTYPYYQGDNFGYFRGYIINRYLDNMQNITTGDMKRMQTDNYNVMAEFARKILMKTDESRLSADEKKYFQIYKHWDDRYDAKEEGATVFWFWWEALNDAIWSDEFSRTKLPLPEPQDFTLIESLLRDTAYTFIDNINTPEKETLQDQLLASLKKATSTLKDLDAQGRLEWTKLRDEKIQHLLRLNPLGRLHVRSSGGFDVINADNGSGHGPAWRMIVQLSDTIEAYGNFPGGESGNPGSKYYDNFINSFAADKYYKLWFMQPDEENSDKIKWTMHFKSK